MPASFMKKTMAYLGLVDDDYDDYDDYESRSSVGVGRTSQRPAGAVEEVDEPTTAMPRCACGTSSTRSGLGC